MLSVHTMRGMAARNTQQGGALNALDSLSSGSITFLCARDSLYPTSEGLSIKCVYLREVNQAALIEGNA